MTRSFSLLSELGAGAPLDEVREMPAPAQIRGLADTLRDQLTRATARAAAVGERARSSVANLHDVLDQADGVVADVDRAAAEVQAALGLTGNGGPEVVPPGAPDAAAPAAPAASAPPLAMQRSPIGFIARRT